jgi:hypothetical protein
MKTKGVAERFQATAGLGAASATSEPRRTPVETKARNRFMSFRLFFLLVAASRAVVLVG